MSALKPCPFCGEADLLEIHQPTTVGAFVRCQNCTVEGPWSAKNSGDATDKWNTRSHGEWSDEPPNRPGLWISARDGSYIEGQFATVEDLRHPRHARLIRPGAKWIGPFEVENPFQQ